MLVARETFGGAKNAPSTIAHSPPVFNSYVGYGPAQPKAGEHEGCPLASIFPLEVVAGAQPLRKPGYSRYS
jgi:hypothetical protein